MKYNTKYLSTGFLYFYIHFVTELVCFFVLGRYVESVPLTWLIMISYDMLAFVPQALFGYMCDKFPKINLAIPGLVLLGLAPFLQDTVSSPFVSLIVLCIGNAFVHVNGAEVTLKASGGSLSHSAIFVSGGSFGVLCGKLLGKTACSYLLLLVPVLSAIPFAILAQIYMREALETVAPPENAFLYHNEKINKYVIIALAVFVVIVRGYMAYGIPTSWNKTVMQTVLLFVFMGIGKALGGILADIFGIKKVAVLSLVFALPLLMFGDNRMIISLIGVMLFSMTMSITLGVLVSVLPHTPGLAFGLTTIGLFIGSLPVAFIKIESQLINCIMLSVMTVICVISLIIILRKEDCCE